MLHFLFLFFLCILHGAMGCSQKSFTLVVWQCHQLDSQSKATCSECHISHVCQTNKGDNKVKMGAQHRSPGIHFTPEGNPRNPLLGDHLMKAVLLFIASNGVPYLQIRSVGLHIMSGREKKGKKEKSVMGWQWGQCPWKHFPYIQVSNVLQTDSYN